MRASLQVTFVEYYNIHNRYILASIEQVKCGLLYQFLAVILGHQNLQMFS